MMMMMCRRPAGSERLCVSIRIRNQKMMLSGTGDCLSIHVISDMIGVGVVRKKETKTKTKKESLSLSLSFCHGVGG